jgi:cyanophycinase
MHWICLFALLVSCELAPFADAEESPPKGKLLLAGGGSTKNEIVTTALKLAGGEDARVLIVPQASGSPDAGAGSEKHWSEHGAKQIAILDLTDRDAARKQIQEATLIWMPGGDQSRLVKALKDADLATAIRDRYREGAVVGGTSAGAAAASGVMLTGGADLTRLLADSTPTAPGLDLWPEVIVDQHFVARNRFNRLLAAVLDRPQLVGVGVDERTAVVVSGSEFEVIGEGQVLVIDARPATTQKATTSQPHAATRISLHVLKAGMKFDLGARTTEKPGP